MILIIFMLVFKIVSCSDQYVSVCGFPPGTPRCKMTDIACINNIDRDSRKFFNSPEARDLSLPQIDPLSIPKFDFYVREFKVKMMDVKITGLLDGGQSYGSAKEANATLTSYFTYSGTLTAKSAFVVNVIDNQLIASVDNLSLSFNELGAKTLISIIARKRCDGIYFEKVGINAFNVKTKETAILLCSGFDVLLKNLKVQGVDYDEFVEALSLQMSRTLSWTLLDTIKLLHISQQANKMWILPDNLPLNVLLDTSKLSSNVATSAVAVTST